MDYEKLKEVIAKQIKENGKREITGPVLQAVLMAMVDCLGEVYPHTYTDEEKAQARANIDALSNYDGEITKEKLSIEVQAILNDVANKQNITDESLATIAKTIVGAINEVYKGGLKDASIATSKIEDGAITEDKLASQSVTNAKIANASVSEEKITDNSVSTGKLKDGAITEPKLDTDLANVITSAVQPAELASAIATALASYVAKADIVDNTGSATDKVMSQHGVTEEINGVTNKVTELEEELNAIKLGSSKIISTVTIPQRSSLGGTDYPLLNTLKKGIPYKLTKTCSDPSKYNNFRFKAGSTNVNFYIDSTYITGYATVSDGVHTLILDDDATTIRSTDNTGTSIEIEIAENLTGIYQVEKDIQEGLYPLLKSKPLYDYTVKNQGLCIDNYISSIGAYRLMASYNGFNFSDQLDNNKIANIKYENTVHDSQIVVKGDIAYVVYTANTDISDNAGSPTSKVILTKFNINDFVGTRVDLEVAKSGSNQQTGGAGQPNIVADETDTDLLHIIYTCNSNGYTIFTCDYSVSNGTCSNYREVIASNKAGETGNLRNGDINRLFSKNFTGNDSTYHSQQCNSTIAYSNGYYYIGMVIDNGYLQDKNLAIIFKTQDFTNWDYFADYDSFNEPCMCELAIGVDSNGNIYSASRPSNLYSQNMGQYGATYGVIAKWSSNGVLKERRYYRNCGTRPSFFSYNGDLYLISNTWYRSICDIIRVNTEQLTASELYAQFKKPSFHYISCTLYGDYVIVSSSSSNIEVSKITWPVSISENDAYTKIRKLIM